MVPALPIFLPVGRSTVFQILMNGHCTSNTYLDTLIIRTKAFITDTLVFIKTFRKIFRVIIYEGES
jgi:hypothetical protein